MKMPSLLLSLLLAAPPVLAALEDLPTLKPGLWEMSTVTSNRPKEQGPMKSTACLDAATAKEMFRFAQGAMAGMCSKFDINKAGGNKFSTEAVCTIGGSTIRSKAVMTVSGNTSYRTEGTATYDPPFMGMKESTTLVEAKHVGPCKPGMQPGDITTPTGQTINLRNLSGAK